MKALGGFFELEQRHGRGPWHTGALALTSGRACFRKILEMARPSRMLVPFFICDAALEPLRMLGVPFEFYGLTASLDPAVSTWPSDASVLYVNYFDLKNDGAAALVSALDGRAVVDDTQAFFRRGHGRGWSFNSARKSFGVPDGAYAYGPGLAGATAGSAREHVKSAHLTTRMTGPQDLAYQQYLEAEADVSAEVIAPSAMAGDLLSAIAYEDARQARRRNYSVVHDRLSKMNMLDMKVALGTHDEGTAPFCYPLLPLRPSLHQALWRRQIFVPRLWPEVVTRSGAGFAWERDLASRLLPLPIDHRYDERDMNQLCDDVLEVAA